MQNHRIHTCNAVVVLAVLLLNSQWALAGPEAEERPARPSESEPMSVSTPTDDQLSARLLYHGMDGLGTSEGSVATAFSRVVNSDMNNIRKEFKTYCVKQKEPKASEEDKKCTLDTWIKEESKLKKNPLILAYMNGPPNGEFNIAAVFEALYPRGTKDKILKKITSDAKTVLLTEFAKLVFHPDRGDKVKTAFETYCKEKKSGAECDLTKLLSVDGDASHYAPLLISLLGGSTSAEDMYAAMKGLGTATGRFMSVIIRVDDGTLKKLPEEFQNVCIAKEKKKADQCMLLKWAKDESKLKKFMDLIEAKLGGAVEQDFELSARMLFYGMEGAGTSEGSVSAAFIRSTPQTIEGIKKAFVPICRAQKPKKKDDECALDKWVSEERSLKENPLILALLKGQKGDGTFDSEAALQAFYPDSITGKAKKVLLNLVRSSSAKNTILAQVAKLVFDVQAGKKASEQFEKLCKDAPKTKTCTLIGLCEKDNDLKHYVPLFKTMLGVDTNAAEDVYFAMEGSGTSTGHFMSAIVRQDRNKLKKLPSEYQSYCKTKKPKDKCSLVDTAKEEKKLAKFMDLIEGRLKG